MKKTDNPPPATVAVRKRTRQQSQTKASATAMVEGITTDKEPKKSNKPIHTQAGTAVTVDACGNPKEAEGRPDRRRDPELVASLLQYIFAGNPYKHACVLAGVDETTFFRWMREGKTAEEGTLAYSFYQRVKRANADAAHRNMMRIQKSVPGWQSSAWFLERRFPDEYGATSRIKLGSDEENPLVVGTVGLQVDDRVLSDKGAFAALKAVLARKPELLNG